MRYIKHLVRRYPMQSFLILFNAGVFTWLQTTGTMIAYRLDLSGDDIWIYVPTWVNTLTSHSLESIRTLYGASGYNHRCHQPSQTWFVTFLKGLMRAVVLVLVIAIGLWLVYRHFELLQNLKLS